MKKYYLYALSLIFTVARLIWFGLTRGDMFYDAWGTLILTLFLLVLSAVIMRKERF